MLSIFTERLLPARLNPLTFLCTIIGVERVLLLHILSTEKWNRKLKKPVCIGSETQGGKKNFSTNKKDFRNKEKLKSAKITSTDENL